MPNGLSWHARCSLEGMNQLALLGLALVACVPSQTAPQVSATHTTGASADDVSTMFRTAGEPVRRCVGGGSGKITFRVTNQDGVLHVTPEPAASLDPRAQACAMDALSAIWLEETGSNVGGPAVPPPGFVSLVTVAW